MTPSFLKNAKKVEDVSVEQPVAQISQENKPSLPFLKNAKQVSQGQKQEYISDEQIERDIERNIGRGTSRVAESLFGAPGDIFSFITGLTGQEQNILPTSGKLRELSEKYLGTAPQNEFEEFGDEILSDVGSMLTPGAGKYNLVRNLGIPIVSNLAKEGIKYAGADEKNASGAKIGLMIGLDLLAHKGKGGAKAFSGNLFNEAEKLIPQGALMDSKKLNKSILALKEDLKKGGSRPSTEKALKKANEIQKDINAGNGKIDPKKLVEYRKSINELIDELGGFDIKLPQKIKKRAVDRLNDVKKTVISGLEEYGQTQNHSFLKLHRAANESFAAYEASNKVANFLKKRAGNIKNPAVKALFGLSPLGAGITYASPTIAMIGAAGGVGLAGGYQGFKVFLRMKNSPTLRGYYSNIINGALKGNSAQVTKNLKKLDESMAREDFD